MFVVKLPSVSSMSVSSGDGTWWCSEPSLVWDQLRQAWAKAARELQGRAILGNEVVRSVGLDPSINTWDIHLLP